MGRKTDYDVIDSARILFYEGYTNDRIAKVVGRSPKTISNWRTKYKWDDAKATSLLSKETAEEATLELLNHNLMVLKHQKEEALAEGKLELIPNGAIDSLVKLFAAIKGKQKTWSVYVSVCRELLQFLQGEDLELAQTIAPVFDSFLNAKQKDL